MTKSEAIKMVMLSHGGLASLKMIYNQIEKYYPEAKHSKDWQAGVRGVLYRDIGTKFKKIQNGIYSVIDFDEYYDIKSQLINTNDTEREILVRVRTMQNQFRSELLKVMPFCPITGISDKRLLVASHIKPWCFSNGLERIDINNGFMFSPIYDKLFDAGLITFTMDKKIVVSSTVSKDTMEKLNIVEKTYDNLCLLGREKYLCFHQEYIFIE